MSIRYEIDGLPVVTLPEGFDVIDSGVWAEGEPVEGKVYLDEDYGLWKVENEVLFFSNPVYDNKWEVFSGDWEDAVDEYGSMKEAWVY